MDVCPHEGTAVRGGREEDNGWATLGGILSVGCGELGMLVVRHLDPDSYVALASTSRSIRDLLRSGGMRRACARLMQRGRVLDVWVNLAGYLELHREDHDGVAPPHVVYVRCRREISRHVRYLVHACLDVQRRLETPEPKPLPHATVEPSHLLHPRDRLARQNRNRAPPRSLGTHDEKTAPAIAPKCYATLAHAVWAMRRCIVRTLAGAVATNNVPVAHLCIDTAVRLTGSTLHALGFTPVADRFDPDWLDHYMHNHGKNRRAGLPASPLGNPFGGLLDGVDVDPPAHYEPWLTAASEVDERSWRPFDMSGFGFKKAFAHAVRVRTRSRVWALALFTTGLALGAYAKDAATMDAWMHRVGRDRCDEIDEHISAYDFSLDAWCPVKWMAAIVSARTTVIGAADPLFDALSQGLSGVVRSAQVDPIDYHSDSIYRFYRHNVFRWPATPVMQHSWRVQCQAAVIAAQSAHGKVIGFDASPLHARAARASASCSGTTAADNNKHSVLHVFADYRACLLPVPVGTWPVVDASAALDAIQSWCHSASTALLAGTLHPHQRLDLLRAAVSLVLHIGQAATDGPRIEILDYVCRPVLVGALVGAVRRAAIRCPASMGVLMTLALVNLRQAHALLWTLYDTAAHGYRCKHIVNLMNEPDPTDEPPADVDDANPDQQYDEARARIVYWSRLMASGFLAESGATDADARFALAEADTHRAAALTRARPLPNAIVVPASQPVDPPKGRAAKRPDHQRQSVGTVARPRAKRRRTNSKHGPPAAARQR
ncbi:hypothetical protein pclt_cds_1111 [Pandoravirus celtis]|uniref:Uncharacterized protein n=1 Tax=Pandoravirus celtis TaxID=2568002 RepID=A0A4D6EJ05_9VIRU|nr:hypothetical protein pclt_cds_1111 [Pandoravirus celtis]